MKNKSILVVVLFLLSVQFVAQGTQVWEGDITVDVFSVYNTDVIDIRSGAIVNLYDPGYLGLQVNLEAGWVGNNYLYPTLNMYGGEIVYINAFQGIASFYGGTVSGNIAAHGGYYHVYGYDFDYNPDIGRLTGLWENGTPFSINMNPLSSDQPNYQAVWSAVTLHEIPEPATLLLLGLGGLMLRRKR